jgi:hypothetical protein
MIEVRRDDGELCGFVRAEGDHWTALTVFGGVLDVVDTAEAARSVVLADGLRVLADHWTLVDGVTGEEEVVLIQQCSPNEVTLAIGYYSLPGVPSITIPVTDLLTGRWRLDHRS